MSLVYSLSNLKIQCFKLKEQRKGKQLFSSNVLDASLKVS